MLIKKREISTLKIGSPAEYNYFSERNELLIGRGTIITDRLLHLLQRRNVFELYIHQVEEDEKKDFLIRSLSSKKSEYSSLYEDIEDNEPQSKGIAVPPGDNEKIVKSLDQKLEKGIQTDSPEGIAYKTFANQIKVGERTAEYISVITDSYTQALEIVQSAINAILNGERDISSQLKSIIEKFTALFLSDKNILLNISSKKPDGVEHLYCHSLNVCILSINIAASYGYNKDQINEIGIGALLHDIGMFLIPPKIRHKNERFSKEEWYEIKKHPITGLHLLEKIHRLPESALYVAYQTHERQNATGYPKQRSNNHIHNFAKIVQVADIYEALSSPRPHRNAVLPFNSAENLVKMATLGLISKKVVKAFITYMSTYPIGSLVLLSNRCIAKVVDVNHGFLRKPVVSVLTNSIGAPLTKKNYYQIDLLKKKDIFIVKPLPQSAFSQINIMDGF